MEFAGKWKLAETWLRDMPGGEWRFAAMRPHDIRWVWQFDEFELFDLDDETMVSVGRFSCYSSPAHREEMLFSWRPATALLRIDNPFVPNFPRHATFGGHYRVDWICPGGCWLHCLNNDIWGDPDEYGMRHRIERVG